jgi:general secretion pathway protein A
VATAAAPPPLAQPQALGELASLWNVRLEEGSCAAAAEAGLRCLGGRGGVFDLRQLDRPAVIALREGGQATHAVLAGLDGDVAVLRSGGRQFRMPLARLAERFDGSYTTLWKVSDAMSTATRDQLLAFQRANDLKADGKAGPRTHMRWNALNGVAEPRLLAKGVK